MYFFLNIFRITSKANISRECVHTCMHTRDHAYVLLSWSDTYERSPYFPWTYEIRQFTCLTRTILKTLNARDLPQYNRRLVTVLRSKCVHMRKNRGSKAFIIASRNMQVKHIEQNEKTNCIILSLIKTML